MTKFIEVQLNGKLTAINIDNIAMITRISEFETEFELLTKDASNSPTKFRVSKNYSEFKLVLTNQDRLAFDFAVNAH